MMSSRRSWKLRLLAVGLVWMLEIKESKQVVSYHLKVMAKAGVVRLRHEGRETRCYVTDEFQRYVRVNNGSMIG